MDNQVEIQKIDAETQELFSRARVDWSTSKEAIFSEKFEALLSEPKTKVVSFPSAIIRRSVAASILVLVGLTTIAFFYSKTIDSPAGSHLTAQLPDGSTVEMNAETSLKYYPWRWYFQRKVEMEGEAFFSVKKGKKFTVESRLGETTVLGTTFNIYTRDGNYKVLCLTGKVGVSAAGKYVLLLPNQHAEIQSGKLVKIENISQPENIISWRENRFIFSSVSFSEVVREIERQYGITISSDLPLSGTISVSFRKEADVDKILSMVCKPLGYSFVKNSDNNYKITGSN